MAISVDLTDEIGRLSNYHNINKITFDFILGIIKVELNNYANEKYRNIQKQQEINNQKNIDRYYELKNKWF